jgi:TPP-dependent pyruvate/acetoin dehydrogenase alpha subunit
MLRDMIRIRVFEETVEQEVMQGHVYGGVHLAIGQEAVAVGAHYGLHPHDYVTGSHRGHHVCLARGVDPAKMMAELMGKETGLARGKSSSMHFVDKEHGVLGLNGIVGAAVGIATGAAFSIKYLGEEDRVAVAFFGEGAANKGQFHESLNLAGLWKLPVIYLCENNNYSVETAFEKATAGGSVARRAASYGFPGVEVDGMDVTAVAAAVAAARDRAVRQEGPTLIEARTYRYRGHDIGDPQNYRTRDEVERWREHDPIQRLAVIMEAEGVLDEQALVALRTEVEAEIDMARQFGLDSPGPDRRVAYEFVYAQREGEG